MKIKISKSKLADLRLELLVLRNNLKTFELEYKRKKKTV